MIKARRYLYASRWNWWASNTLPSTITAFNSLTGTNLASIQSMFNSLNAAGLWDKITDMYPFVGSTEVSQSINLRNPGVNSIAFKPGGTYGAGGMTPGGALSDRDMVSVPPLMVGGNRSFSFGAYYSTTVLGTNATSIRLTDGNGIFHVFTDGVVYLELFGGNQGLGFALGGSKMVSGSTGSGIQTFYRSGVSVASGPVFGSNGSTGIAASIGSGNLSTFSVVFFGYELTASEQASMFSICDAFNTAMGR